MLDTNIVSDLVRNPDGVVSTRLRELGDGAACVSIITSAELLFGARRIKSLRLEATIRAILSVVPPLPFEHPADETYSAIRAALAARGTPIGPHDLFIAAQALTLDLTIVTANVREFARVDELRVVNWLD